MNWDQADTPCLVADLNRLDANIQDVADRAADRGMSLRPHIKTHKMVDIARRQLEAGAIGLTTAKLSEAEALAAAGLTDLFVCYPLIGHQKLERLKSLSRKANVMTVVDSKQGARTLSQAFSSEGRIIDILIKLDAGMGRVGVPPENIGMLASELESLTGIQLRGVCIHEGSAYGEPDPSRRYEIARTQGKRLVDVAADLRSRGHHIDIVSAGSTPGLDGILSVDGITEVRPGNYVFFDAMQVALGVVPLDRCALWVISTVVSCHGERAIVDAGSKTLTLDKGGHGMSLLDGYGVVLEHPRVTIEKLSEEHGWLKVPSDEALEIGERLTLVPNHACAVVNNFAEAWVVRGEEVVGKWPVTARGCVT